MEPDTVKHVFKKPRIIYSIITEEQSNNIKVVLRPNSNSAAENYSNKGYAW